MSERPDILVLGGGGRQGDAWMSGVLVGLEDAHGFDLRECEYFVGTSAGSIVAAKLAAGRRLRRPPAADATAVQVPLDDAGRAADQQDHGLEGGGQPGGERSTAALVEDAALTALGPLSALGLALGRAPGAALRAAALGLIGPAAGDQLDFSAAFNERFDGRLRVVAVARRSGRRVVFGAPGAPEATVAQALTASCALPGTFPPASIDGEQYVDGAVWSPTNADVTPASQAARVLVLAPMSSRHGPFLSVVRIGARAAMLAEIAALTTRGAQVRYITPDQASARSIGTNVMADTELQRTGAAGYAQGLGS